MVFFLIGGSISLTLLTVLILLFAYYVYNLWTNNIFRRLGIPGPTPIPFLGEMFRVMRKGIYKNDMDLIQKYGKIVGIYQGTSPIILVADLDILRNVLIKDSHVFINRRGIAGVTGPFQHGLTQLKDEHWKNARSIVSPTFSTAKLKTMYGLMNEVSEVYTKRLLVYADKQEMFNIKQLNSEFALDNIATCLFGIETNSLQNENATLINYLKKFFTLSLRNILVLILLISPRLSTYLGKKGYSVLPSDSLNYTTNLLDQILARRRQHLERRNDFIQMMVDREEDVTNEGETSQQTEEQHDDHQQWKPMKKTLNDKEILGQALVFLIAGYETTSVLMSFFFYIMAIQPAIQEKVYHEIQQEIGDNEVTYEKLNELRYLDMVINETLRMYTPFIRTDRVASQDYQLGSYLIPKGSIINISIYPVHHDPEAWPEPEKFIPERFLSIEKAKRHPLTYLPFGDGPRNCIGMRFALLEAKLGIVKALRVAEFQKCEKTEVPLQLGKLAVLNTKNDGVAGVLEHSLITLKDEQWKNVRSLISPTFSSAKLKIMYVLMNEVSEAYSKRLLEYADKQEMFDIQQLNSEFTLDNIATCLFGIETNSLQHENVTLINYLKKFFSFNISNLLFLLIYISPRLVKYLEERGYSILPKDSVDYTTNVINQILDRRRQRLERRNDFIQMMIDHEEESEQTKEDQHDDHQQSKLLKKTLNDKEILGQAFGFLFAGYETTSVLMSFFFYIMATEQRIIQEKVYDEIRQEIGEDEITYEKLNQLHYLDMVISETLRMYPPIFRFERVASADYHLGDYHIPKGMIISVPVYPIHHNADVWTEPEKFIPERFSPAEKAKRHPMAYLPFGDGPRNCLGMRFALLEIKLGIVKALRLVEIQQCEKTEIPIQLSKRPTLSSKNGIWVRVARRVQ
ncbi:hypothetical protein I4U23_026745 [Adineta vaga]|nr:hypothetical protein I4U23_026745 [Adineta vaga]